jgi:hypothetical protein
MLRELVSLIMMRDTRLGSNMQPILLLLLVQQTANHGTTTSDPVQKICNRLNQDFKLDGRKRLARSTVYQAAKVGLAGMSPKTRGLASKIPKKFMKQVAMHSEVSQVGNGELKSKDFKRLIGASVVGTEHEASFKVETVWRKLRTEFPESLKMRGHNGQPSTISTSGLTTSKRT